MSVVPGSTLGQYRIVELLGRGGMATVYKAYQPSLDRYVAVKVLPTFYAEDPAFLERFHQEARAIAKLEHTNILPVFDFGEEGGTTYLVSRLVSGGTLADRLGAPWPLDHVAPILRPIASALDYAHARGIIHRDVKPSNVLMTEEGTPILSDFGIAKMVGSAHLTASTSVMGTPEYMAPEHAVGNPSASSDLYALGIVLYQMLTGQVPFSAETPMAVVLAHLHRPLPLPRTIRPDLPEEVEKVVLKAVAKEPEARFKTAAEMVEALAQASGRPEAIGLPAVPSAAMGRTSLPPDAPSAPPVRPATPPAAARPAGPEQPGVAAPSEPDQPAPVPRQGRSLALPAALAAGLAFVLLVGAYVATSSGTLGPGSPGKVGAPSPVATSPTSAPRAVFSPQVKAADAASTPYLEMTASFMKDLEEDWASTWQWRPSRPLVIQLTSSPDGFGDLLAATRGMPLTEAERVRVASHSSVWTNDSQTRGWAMFVNLRKVSNAYDWDLNFKAFDLAQNYAKIMQMDVARGNSPLWYRDAFAALLASTKVPGASQWRIMRELVKSHYEAGKLPALPAMARNYEAMNAAGGETLTVAREATRLALSHVADKVGAKALLEVERGFASGGTFEAAFQTVTGMTLEQLDAEYKAKFEQSTEPEKI